MQEQSLKDVDETLGLEFEVKKNTKNANRIGFSNSIFAVGEMVYVLSAEQHDNLIKQFNEVNNYKSRIKELENEIATGSNSDIAADLKEKDKIINNLKTQINNLKNQDKTSDNSELTKLQQQLDNKDKNIASLKQELNDNEIHLKYLKESHDNLIVLNDNYKDEFQSTYESNEKELKETITKQQSHIDELTKKLESLLSLKEYISPKQHYDELATLKDKIKEFETEINKVNAEVDMKLATQKSELEINHTNEKAQMLLVYNQELNNYKLHYNELAKDYNHLLEEVNSLSRINTLFNGRHSVIVKDKMPVELEEIEIEKEDSETIEFVRKDEVKLNQLK